MLLALARGQEKKAKAYTLDHAHKGISAAGAFVYIRARSRAPANPNKAMFAAVLNHFDTAAPARMRISTPAARAQA